MRPLCALIGCIAPAVPGTCSLTPPVYGQAQGTGGGRGGKGGKGGRGAQRGPRNSTQRTVRHDSAALTQELTERVASSKYAPMKQVREALPANALAGNVIDAVRAAQVVFITGETGSGKTTQVPQFVLDDADRQGDGARCSIVCTQPRRIAAMGVAARVADERCERIGDTVGHAIRGESKVSPRTRLLFCTTGVLLRRLQGDPMLESVSHIMVDEVHERSLDSDFLLVLVKDLLVKRPGLKLVMMSATLDAQLFENYFKGCRCVHIPGRTHPVTDHHLDDFLHHTGIEATPSGRLIRSRGASARDPDDSDDDMGAPVSEEPVGGMVEAAVAAAAVDKGGLHYGVLEGTVYAPHAGHMPPICRTTEDCLPPLT